jgi:hypothetical protein
VAQPHELREHLRARNDRDLPPRGLAEVTGGEDKVSILAPLGSALLGLSVGQQIDWPVPGGRMARIRILGVVSKPGRVGG